jgi:hypothetical protein
LKPETPDFWHSILPKNRASSPRSPLASQTFSTVDAGRIKLERLGGQ